MKNNPAPQLALLLLATAASTTTSRAQVLFSDSFDANSTANWQVNLSHADAFANVFFDYSTLGIPSAPNSTGGSTLGISFLVNQSAGVFQGISASPIGLGLSGDYVLNVDMWMNYVGPLGPGGSGTTQFASVGIGSSGATTQWAGGSSGTLFAMSLDGNSGSDYRVYANNVHQTATSVYAAGSQNNSATYHMDAFPGQTAPDAQLGLYPEQTGTTLAGSVGFAWRDVEIRKEGSAITYSIDGTLIATIGSADTLNLSTNISLGLFDSNAGSSTSGNDFLNTAIFDNLRVAAVPEPGTAALGLIGAGALVALRRRKA